MQLWWLYTFLRFRLALKVLWDRTSDGLEEKSDLIWVRIPRQRDPGESDCSSAFSDAHGL